MSNPGSVERTGDTLLVRGGVTMANVETLLAQGRLALQDGAPAVIDLGAVTEVDSSSVSMLLQWTREAKGRGQRLALVNVPENVRSLAALYGVSELLPPEGVAGLQSGHGASTAA